MVTEGSLLLQRKSHPVRSSHLRLQKSDLWLRILRPVRAKGRKSGRNHTVRRWEVKGVIISSPSNVCSVNYVCREGSFLHSSQRGCHEYRPWAGRLLRAGHWT